MARATTLRWPIEQRFQDGKSELGMGHYELRPWRGWDRRMLYVFVAMLFLLEVRLAFVKRGTRAPVLTVAKVRRLVVAAFEMRHHCRSNW